MIKRIAAFLALLLIIIGVVLIKIEKVSAPFGLWENKEEKETAKQNEVNTFNKNLHSITDSSSIWVVVNKQNQLKPKNYVPVNLVVPNVKLRLGSGSEQMKISKNALADLEAMFAAAKKEGVELVFGSGYRSYSLQTQFYNNYVAKDGQVAADRYSARPGHSEHQAGLAVDITRADGKCHLEICFADTEQGKWLSDHAYKYGFILRYPSDKEPLTGYQYEPWHFRYVGKELAAEMKNQNITALEEFFSLPAAPSY